MPHLPRNYFELFGLTPAFEIDPDVLTARYRDLQRAAHPDRYAHASPQDRRLAVQQAADINDGFRTLKDPVERALHLLSLRGFNVDTTKSTQLDNEFLMEQMELREMLADARAAGLDELSARVEKLEVKILDDLRASLARTDVESLRAAFTLVQKLRFISKLRVEARELEG